MASGSGKQWGKTNRLRAAERDKYGGKTKAQQRSERRQNKADFKRISGGKGADVPF